MFDMGGYWSGGRQVLFVTLFATACGPVDEDPLSKRAREMSEIYSAIGRAECRQWFKCCPPREIALHDVLGATESECVAATEESAALAPSDYLYGLVEGRIVFNIEQARAYLAALESATCSTPDASASRALAIGLILALSSAHAWRRARMARRAR
jgi:hypothetical protein